MNLNWTSEIYFQYFPSNAQAIIQSDAYFKWAGQYPYTSHKFTISRSNPNIINSITYDGYTTGTTSTTNSNNVQSKYMCYLLIDNVVNNGNYTYYGWNQYYQILTRGNSATVTTSNQPYPITDAYVGNVYSNLDYEIYYYSNGQKIYYNGQVTTYTTPTNHGNSIAIAVNEARNS